MGDLAFRQQENAGTPAGKRRPVDLAHLSRQTMGDRDLEREVLRMFIHNARSIIGEIANSVRPDFRASAHKLKGSARAVGAFRLAEMAESCETRRPSRAMLGEIHDELACIEDFVASTQR